MTSKEEEMIGSCMAFQVLQAELRQLQRPVTTFKSFTTYDKTDNWLAESLPLQDSGLLWPDLKSPCNTVSNIIH